MFNYHSRWVKKVEDIMMKMFPWPLPSLISSVIACLYYGCFTYHYYFGSHSKDLLITLYVKLMTPARAWNDIQPSCFCQSRRDLRMSKLQLTVISCTTVSILPSFIFFCRTLNFIWFFVQYLLQQEPFS